jgi:hypothetical protein
MAILGGSPLGLIGVQSTTSKGGRSTFNGGGSRNVNVSGYNQSKGNIYYANDSGNSLFTGRRVTNPWPEVAFVESGFFDTTGSDTDQKYKRSEINKNDSEYDTSVLNIIEKLANTKAALRPTDFAYCKNLGVYPNNRLVIVRRFVGPSEDNLFTKMMGGEIGPLGVVITWIKEDEDFLSLDFGEEWEEAEGSFSGIINSIGEDFGKKSLGAIAEGGFSAVPFPGFTEIMTRKFMAKMGILNEDESSLPVGNPNLIKQAKVRKTIGYDQVGSGLNTTFSFKVTAEYELKFISGIDPTLVWMDLISNFLRFGTSKSDTFGLNKKFSQNLKQWINNPSLLVKKMAASLKSVITESIEKFKQEINELVSSEGDKPQQSDNPTQREKNKAMSFINKIEKNIEGILKKILSKYKIKAIGIINALSGLPSTPWHITIGNPMRPIFSSGDMYMDSVNLKLGSQLSFNDLPTNLTVEFTLKNARAWGMQEIMSKFNKGYLRAISFTSKMPLSYNEINDTKVYATYSQGTNTTSTTNNTPGSSTPGSETPVDTSASTVVDNVPTVKAENNKVPMNGTKDDKGNLTFKKDERLVIVDKPNTATPILDKNGKPYPTTTYTYVKNKDGSFTEYKTTLGDPKKNETKIIEANTPDGKKLSNMFNSKGVLLKDAQDNIKGDKDGGISGVNWDTSSKSKQDQALSNASKGVVNSPGSDFAADVASRNSNPITAQTNKVSIDNNYKGPTITNKK